MEMLIWCKLILHSVKLFYIVSAYRIFYFFKGFDSYAPTV
jgi:hypothetical protein